MIDCENEIQEVTTSIMATKVSTNKYFEVRESRVQGKGAFATKKIRKGTRVIEYTGEIISPEEESKRYDDENMDRHHTFLFAIDEKHTIDAGPYGSDAKYINHSCDPNCEAVNDDGRIFIEAIQTIQPGEELNYDYGYEQETKPTKEELALYPCHCGSKNCRGTILKYTPKRKKKSKSSKKKR